MEESIRNYKGITHREAIVLLECDQDDLNQEIASLAKEIKENLLDTFHWNTGFVIDAINADNIDRVQALSRRVKAGDTDAINEIHYVQYYQKSKYFQQIVLNQQVIVLFYSLTYHLYGRIILVMDLHLVVPYKDNHHYLL